MLSHASGFGFSAWQVWAPTFGLGSAVLKGCGCPWRMFSLRITFSVTNLISGIQSHWSVTRSTAPPCSGRGKELETDDACGNSPIENQFQEEAWAGLDHYWCWLKWLARVPRRRCLGLISNWCVWCKWELTGSHGQKGLQIKSWKQ